MKKNILIVLCLIMFITSNCSEKQLTKFQWVEYDGNKFSLSEESLTHVELNHVKQVLSYYKIEYNVLDSFTILVSSKLYDDLELMYSYNKKAHDLNWLKRHSLHED